MCQKNYTAKIISMLLYFWKLEAFFDNSIIVVPMF